MSGETPRRLRDLPSTEVLGSRFPVAESRRARLLGLALLDRRRAGPGLVLPRCRSVHTFGMRFPLDLYFLGTDGEARAVRRDVPPRRVAFEPGARSVLEVPARGG